MNMLLSNVNISELPHYLVNHYYDHHVGITSAAEKGLKTDGNDVKCNVFNFSATQTFPFLGLKKVTFK